MGVYNFFVTFGDIRDCMGRPLDLPSKIRGGVWRVGYCSVF